MVAAPELAEGREAGPQAETVIAGNLVVDNDNLQTPPIAQGFFGGGIAIGGGTKNTVLRNRVQGHDAYGIRIVSLVGFDASNNRVEGNVLSDNGVDLVYPPDAATTDQRGNCFVDNTFTSSAPAAIEQVAPCTSARALASPTAAAASVAAPAGLDYRKLPAPAAQPGMTDPATAPASPAVALVPAIDLATIRVPPVP